ncbi:MAG: NAD(P)-dependent dehydrogenase (short-subunit alcohol dehydrogenase family) [Myxococcota bacterium]|jgi:NAD(P)-dependent dehydrogenase (short-subunit alcohol dehydrogenase family)
MSHTPKHVVITGGSSGIGLAMTRSLTSKGHRVAVIAQRPEAIFREANPDLPDVSYIAHDLRDLDGAAERLDEIVAGWDRLDVLVNNAGIKRFEKATDSTAESISAHLEVNLAAPIRLSAAAASVMRRQTDGGLIINVASVYGLKPTAELASYGASKAGLIHYTRALAAELASDGVRANVICPGAVRTNLMSRAHFNMAERGVPLGRCQTPEEIADLVGWLMSDFARNITGSVINLDGGMSL